MPPLKPIKSSLKDHVFNGSLYGLMEKSTRHYWRTNGHYMENKSLVRRCLLLERQDYRWQETLRRSVPRCVCSDTPAGGRESAHSRQ